MLCRGQRWACWGRVQCTRVLVYACLLIATWNCDSTELRAAPSERRPWRVFRLPRETLVLAPQVDVHKHLDIVGSGRWLVQLARVSGRLADGLDVLRIEDEPDR